ncbi:MAG: putative pyruvoyl-dependent arginine decarboxylase [Parcubacteria group bacterium GW2011_GWF2_43_11]|nr:MAG: putative pyruvoyl-dependent arginine decarboxylase [Parcubacteria group bacterium GW2011_GWF2_43_11]
MVPTKFFLTKGVGIHRDYLASFELALRDAGMAAFNLVSVSSILPPGCKKVTRTKGLEFLSPGEVVFVVLARNATNESNRLLSASVGCAIPADKQKYGYLSEHHPFGETSDKAGDYAEDLAASMLASTLGLKFDPNAVGYRARLCAPLTSLKVSEAIKTVVGFPLLPWPFSFLK